MLKNYYMKYFLKFVKIFTILIVSFSIFSVLSCLLPYKYIQKNIEKSLPELYDENRSSCAILYGKEYQQDDFTHALIINIIASSDSKKPIRSAMTNPYSFQAPDTKHWYAYKHLEHKVNHIDLTPNIHYGRYWHGTAAVGRILLLFMTYQQIKWLLYLVSTLLFLVFAVKIVNKAGWIKSLPIFLAFLFANFFVTQFSLQFFPVMAISLIAGIWMSSNGLKPQGKLNMFLFIIGMLTAYFDLLTTPLLTLGIPLIVYLILQTEEKKTVWELFRAIMLLCIFWFIGFAGAWAMKWILVAILTDSTTIYALETVRYRTTTNGFTRWDVIVSNVGLLPLVWLNTILTGLLLLTFLSFNKKGIPLAIAFLMVGLLPYVWYFVLSGHSYTHWWFTYRAQIISMACAMSAFVSLIDWERLKSKLKIR